MSLVERRRSKFWILFACILVIIVTVAIWWRIEHDSRPMMAVPAVDLEQSEPAVASAISRAIARVEHEPRSGEAWGELGMILFAHQFEFEATQCLEQAELLDPKELRWPYLLGLIQSVVDRQVAAEHFRRAVQLDENYGSAHCRLGELMLDLGELSEAKVHLSAAVKLQRDDPRPHLALARLARIQGQFDDAVALAERAVRLAPNQRAPHEFLATLQQQRGNRVEAIKELQLAESLPSSPLPWNDAIAAEVLRLRQDAGWILEQSQGLAGAGRLGEAVQLLEEALDHDSQDLRLVVGLGRVLVQANRMAEAQRVLAKAANDNPDSAEIVFQLGVAYFFDDRFSKAETAFKTAIRLKPDYALAHFNLGHVAEKLDDQQGALRAFQKAASYRPTYAAAHTNAGRLLLAQGEIQEALDHLRHSVRLVPEDRLARDLLDRATRQSRQ